MLLKTFDPVDIIRNELDRTLGYSPSPRPIPCEYRENADHYFMRFELPGLTIDDIDVEVTSDSIKVTGEKKVSDATRSEFYYGTFTRKLTLPGRVNKDDVRADYTNGILSVTLPKTETSGSVKVRVT